MKKKVDIIASCFNEEDNIIPFFDEAIKHLDDKYDYNIVYINDGSSDKTYENALKIVKKENKICDVSVISFVHNFGHESAMCAGLEISDADYMIFMDVDLQNPPSKIPEVLREFENGADCVLLRRVKYKTASFLKKLTSKGYYLFSSIVLRNKNARDVSDFFAVDKNLAKKVSENYKTRLRFLRSFIQHEANDIHFVNYENAKRYSGVSRYNYLKLTKLAAISELSRVKFLRNIYKATDEKPIYIIDREKTIYK